MKITEEPGASASRRAYRYDWKIKTRPPGGKKFTRLQFQAREELSILKPEDVLTPIRDFGRFDLVCLCRDYRKDLPFRPGDKNLVAVLKKR